MHTAPMLQKALTRRYCVALSLVFCVILATFTVFTKQARIAENDAYLINISGMQRMLSQRVALMAKEVLYAKSGDEADLYAAELEKSMARMYQNHSALTSGTLSPSKSYTLSPELQTMYFGPKKLDERVKNNLQAAQAFLDLYREQGLDVMRVALSLERNIAMTRIDLLKDLNAAVETYESEAQGRIESFKRLELAFFLIGLCILIGEVLYIFQPMVRMIVSRTLALEATNTELKDLSYQLAQKLQRSASKPNGR